MKFISEKFGVNILKTSRWQEYYTKDKTSHYTGGQPNFNYINSVQGWMSQHSKRLWKFVKYYFRIYWMKSINNLIIFRTTTLSNRESWVRQYFNPWIERQNTCRFIIRLWTFSRQLQYTTYDIIHSCGEFEAKRIFGASKRITAIEKLWKMQLNSHSWQRIYEQTLNCDWINELVVGALVI